MTGATYEFRYFNALSSIPVVERLAFGSDGEGGSGASRNSCAYPTARP
ncbi:MAG: hypothetical protein JWR59_1554 [Brevundimonas sp.]|nr:hypothetical protein [Brevundimonas sp.]